ncbi:MAG: autotransporter-associated beta strand repeat-containing protein, partial [Candidatus Spyradosoma sp.]
DRSGFTGTLDVQAGTVVLGEQGAASDGVYRSTESATIHVGENGAVRVSGEILNNNDRVETLAKVTGTGKIIVNGGGSLNDQRMVQFNIVNGDDFTGTVELVNAHITAADTLFASGAGALTASTFGNASLIVLKNSALNFTNSAAEFAYNVEVAENSQVRVYGNNAGATISGDVYGAGTLTVTDGGKLILSGNVGTLGDDDAPAKTLGGLMLASGSLEISGVEMNVAGDVSLAGTAKIAAANGRVGGSVSMSGAGGLELGGTLEVVGNVSRAEARGQDGRTTTILAGAEVSVGGNMSFGNYENLVLEDGANLSVTGSLTNQWGFNATLGAGATLSAGTLASTTIWDEGRFLSFVGTGENVLVRADAISLNSGWGAGNQNARANFENLRLEIGAAGIDNAGFDTNWVRLKDVTLGVLGDADGWSTGAALKLNGGTTTFDTAEGKTITLNGAVSEAVETATGTEGDPDYVAATTSELVKTGAGTLVLTQSNKNAGVTTVSEGVLEYRLADASYVQGESAPDVPAGLTVADGATLKFTSTSTTDKTIELGGTGGVVSLNFDAGSSLVAGRNTTVALGAATLLAGDVTFSSETGGKLKVLSGYSEQQSAYISSLTLDGGSVKTSVEIDAGATLALSDLRIKGNYASEISGDGTLKLNGTVSVGNTVSNAISASALELTGDTAFSLAKDSRLTVSSDTVSAGGNTLTKAGDGRLIFGADSLQNFDGSFAIEAGTVAINDGGFLRVGGENSFSIASGTTLSGGLKLGVGNAADVLTSAVIGGSTVGGDVEIGNADLTFDGTLSGVARLDWNGPLTVTLSDEFRAAITAASGQMHLVGFSSGYVNGEAISSATDFGDIVDSNAFLGRDVEVVYTESGAAKYIDVIVTGALLWNETVEDWTQGTPISGYGDVDKWDVVVRDGTEEGAAAFEAGKFVQFTKSGSMTLLGTVNSSVTTNGTTRYYGNGVVNTAGMNFAVKNGDDDGTFILKARRDGQEKQQTSTIYGIGSDAVGYQDEGITISAGNIIFEEKIVNKLTGGLRIYGGSLQVSSADALGLGEYDVDSRTYATGEILLGSTTARNASAKLVFQNVNQKTDVDAEDDFLDIEAAHTIHVGNKGAEISVIESLGVVKLTGDLLRADGALEARLTKSGAGTLEISRGRDVYADDPDKRLDSVRVAGGTLVLADTGDLPTSAWTVDSGATLSVDQGDGLLLGSVTLGGALAVGGQGEFRAVQIVSSSTGATISGTLVVSDATELADGSKGTVIDTSAGDVALTGTVNAAAGTTDGKLYKSGAGTLTLTAAPDEGATRGKFRLSADFVQSGGTVSFSNGVLATGTYEIGASSTVSVANAELSGDNTFEKGLKVAGGASVQFALGANTWKTNDAENRLVFNGEFSMEAGSSIAFTSAAGESVNKSRVREVLISDIDSGAVSFGEILRIEEGRLYGGQLRIGGLGDNGGAMGLVNLTVKADNFSAGIVSVGGLSSLKLSNETGGAMTSAKAQVIYVESRASDLNAAVLDLSSGTRLEVGNDLGLTVLQGTGTLRVKGGVLSVDGYSDADGTPSILLDGADFNFSVVENAGQISSLKKISTTANGGSVRKSGAGTLALLDASGDIAFSGGIGLDEGATHLYSRVKNADVTISDGASLRLYIDASAGGEGVEDAGFARGLSGAGTLEVAARFDAKGDLLADFDGTIAAVTSSAVLGTAGRIIAYGDLADWQRNGPATRVVGLSGGFLVFAEEGVELKSVAVDGTGWILGDERETAKIETVKGAAGSSLMLLGNGGTVGDVVFEESDQDAGENNRIWVGGFNYSAGTWRLEGTTTNVDEFLVTGYSELEVAGGNALGTAGVRLQGGGLTFSASGSFGNALTISQNVNAVRVIGGASVELSGTISKTDDGWTMFIAGVEADEEIGTTASAGTLKLSESVLGISGNKQFVANKDSVVSVSVAGADANFGTASSLSGSGTFEKTGAGTLTLNSAYAGEIGALKVSEGTLALGDDLTLAASAGEGSAKRIVAVTGATLTVGKAALSGFTLTGEGDITITSASEGTRFTTIGGIADAENVALSGRLNVSGTISGSDVEFADAQASIAFTGAETGEIVTGTTLSGNTVTLVNAKDSNQSFSVGGAISAIKLVLEGKTGLTGGVVAAEFSGSLEKKGDGGWTVSNYTFGANAGESLEVQAGTLEWQHAKFGAYADDENNSMLVNGTLRIRGVDVGDTLGGTIEGSGMLEIAATRNLTLETEAGTGATWKLKISEGSDVTIATALPGALEVTGEGTRANLELADGDVMTMGVGKQLLVGKGSILEKSGEGTLELANTDAKAVSRIDGELFVTAGTVVQKSMTRWGNDAEIFIDGGTFSVDLSTDDGYNSAKLTGAGTFEVAATDEDGYSLSGDVSGFTGTVSVADGAKLVLGGTDSMLSGASEIRTAGTVAFTHTAGGELKRFTGDGTIEIDVSKNNGFPTARYSYSKDDNAGFDGTLSVRSGVLSVNSDELDELLGNGQISVQVKNGSSAVYDDVLGGIRDGAFLRVVNGTGAPEDVPDFGNALGAKSGVIFAGGTFRAGAGTLVSGGANSLFVTERGSTLSLGNGADVDGSLYVAAGSNLILNEPAATTNASISVFAASSSSEGNSVSGNFTLNGTMTCYVTNENLSGALLNVGGNSFVGTDGSGSARIELNLASDVSLANRDVVLLTNYRGTGNLDDILTVTSGDVNYEISRDGNGNIVIVSAVNDYRAPSGLSGLYSAIKNGNGGVNPLWNYLKSDRANASAMTKKLVALSPVSFGSLLEMQSG